MNVQHRRRLIAGRGARGLFERARLHLHDLALHDVADRETGVHPDQPREFREPGF